MKNANDDFFEFVSKYISKFDWYYIKLKANIEAKFINYSHRIKNFIERYKK